MSYSKHRNFATNVEPEPEPVAPSAPTITVSGPTWDQFDKWWTCSVSLVPKSGDTVTYSIVEFRKTGTTTWTKPEVKGATARIDYLASSQSYEFRGSVANKAGTSPASAVTTRTTQASTPLPPVGVKVTPLNQSLYISWASVPDVASPDTVVAHVTPKAGGTTVSTPVDAKDLDALVDGLTNGTAYTVQLTTTSRYYGSESAKTTVIEATPAAPAVPAPVLTKLTPDNGFAMAVFTEPKLPDGYTLDHYSYRAVDTDGIVDDIEEHIVGNPASAKLALSNDVTWKVSILAFVAPGDIPGDESNTMEVRPEIPIEPYPPHITGASIDSGLAGMINLSWVPGTSSPDTRLGPFDILEWAVEVDPGTPEAVAYPVKDPNARTFTTEKVTLGIHTVVVRARNSVGWSSNSKPVEVKYSPTETRPFTSDIAYGGPYLNKAGWSYAIFDPGNDPKAGWEKTWKLTRTDLGAALDLDVIVVGAGGGGKGQTITLGKGGDGGGGSYTTGTLPKAAKGSTITVVASIGGSTAIDPRDGSVSEGSVNLAAASGKSASSATDAAGSAKKEIPTDWQDYNSFNWNLPGSKYVGGVASSGDQEFPNGFFPGEGGSGTKNGHPGQGQEGIILIRWKA